MQKRIVFVFDERSKVTVQESDIESIVDLQDGRVIVLPKLKGAIECSPTPLALDGANAPDFQQSFPADVLDGDGVLPEPPRQ
jgi:hypothetical protein